MVAPATLSIITFIVGVGNDEKSFCWQFKRSMWLQERVQWSTSLILKSSCYNLSYNPSIGSYMYFFYSAKTCLTSYYYLPSIKTGPGCSPVSVGDSLSLDTWKTGWTCPMVGGSRTSYANSPIFCVIQNGSMKCGINFCKPKVGKWCVLKRTASLT